VKENRITAEITEWPRDRRRSSANATFVPKTAAYYPTWRPWNERRAQKACGILDRGLTNVVEQTPSETNCQSGQRAAASGSLLLHPFVPRSRTGETVKRLILYITFHINRSSFAITNASVVKSRENNRDSAVRSFLIGSQPRNGSNGARDATRMRERKNTRTARVRENGRCQVNRSMDRGEDVTAPCTYVVHAVVAR